MQSREGLVSRRPGDNPGFVGWKWIGLLTQTSELLCSPSLQGRANKSRGKVPVTSFLQPGGGLRRGRERFPGKHREGLEKQLHVTRRDWARGVGLAPVLGPGRPLPGIAALQGSLPERARLQSGRSKSRGKTTISGSRHWPRSPPPCPSPAPHSQRSRARPAPPSPNEFQITPSGLELLVGAPAVGRAPGSRDLPARWIPGQLRGGAGRRRARPADSNFVALGTAQSSLPRRAGGGARAVTQQLARRRAGLCSLLPRPRPGSARLRAAPNRTLTPQCCSACGSLAPPPTLLLQVQSQAPCSPSGLKGGVEAQGLSSRDPKKKKSPSPTPPPPAPLTQARAHIHAVGREGRDNKRFSFHLVFGLERSWVKAVCYFPE